MSNFCPHCGAQVSGANFCPGCGKPSAPLPQKKPVIRNGCLGILALIFVLCVLIAKFSPTPKPPEPSTVSYMVSGDGTASLTFRNESGGTEQKTVQLPWELAFVAKRHAFLYIAAQKKQAEGVIHAEIYVDGNRIQEAESNTAYGIASASGRIP